MWIRASQSWTSSRVSWEQVEAARYNGTHLSRYSSNKELYNWSWSSRRAENKKIQHRSHNFRKNKIKTGNQLSRFKNIKIVWDFFVNSQHLSKIIIYLIILCDLSVDCFYCVLFIIRPGINHQSLESRSIHPEDRDLPEISDHHEKYCACDLILSVGPGRYFNLW